MIQPSQATLRELEAFSGENVSFLIIPDKTGDTKIMWHKDNPDEVAIAKRSFDDLKAKGFMIYKVQDKDGARGEIMQEFDPNAERLVAIKPMMGG